MSVGAQPAHVPVVVFDLDGTLIDTAPDLLRTLNTIFAREGLPQVDYGSARNMVGGGARKMIERGLNTAGRTLPASEAEQLVQEFIEHYAAHIADASRPFPGIKAALDELKAAGCRLAVCTNKLEWLAVKLLRILGLSDRFSAICGADTFRVPKPNPAILLGTIERAGGDPRHAVMVGDSFTDVATARAAGVPIVVVEFGYSETPVAQLDPDRVVEAFSELPGAVFDLLREQAGQFHRTGRGRIHVT
ncbi:MAG TPA: phosphoglycolate phosphatase [Xanthobacteraceae bacterium]|jgi:phosphoglycolate phosphatase